MSESRPRGALVEKISRDATFAPGRPLLGIGREETCRTAVHAAMHKRKGFVPVAFAARLANRPSNAREATMTRSKTLNAMVLGFAFLFVAAIVLGTM